jgi:hypothetical protein
VRSFHDFIAAFSLLFARTARIMCLPHRRGRESDNLRNKLLDEVCGRLFAAGYDLVSFNSNRENPSASAHEEAYLPSLPAYQTLEDSDDENEQNGDVEEDDDDDDNTVVGYEGPCTSNTEILNVTGKRKQSEQSQRRRTKKKSGKKPRKTDMPAPNPTGMSKRAQLNIHEVCLLLVLHRIRA